MAWVEDGDRFPVRTIALWFNKDRYLPELRTWYRSDRLRSMAEGTDLAHSVSSATRSAGHYTLQWDGKDNQGKPVKPGKYTVYIECAREHGGYDLFHREIDFNGTPNKIPDPRGLGDCIRFARLPQNRPIEFRRPCAAIRSGSGGWPRSSRWLHVYLSMFSFAVLMFFAVTGLTLNHANWFDGQERTRNSRVAWTPNG